VTQQAISKRLKAMGKLYTLFRSPNMLIVSKAKLKRIFRKMVKLRFTNSFKFLNASLDKLASYLDKDKLKIVRSEFCKLNAEDLDLLTRKGVFPYEYIDSDENRTRAYHRANYFSVRSQAIPYPRAITFTL